MSDYIRYLLADIRLAARVPQGVVGRRRQRSPQQQRKDGLIGLASARRTPMRIAHEEPLGIWVRIAEGEPFALTFPQFVRGIQSGEVVGNALVCSRIITGGVWVRAEEMRVFQIVQAERRADRKIGLTVRRSPPQESAKRPSASQSRLSFSLKATLMDIYPHNLTPAAAAEVTQLRAMFPTTYPQESFGSQAMRGTLFGGAVSSIFVLLWANNVHEVWLEAVAGVGITVVAAIALYRVGRPHAPTPESPLMVDEVRHALQTARDAMSRAFLELVIAAIETPVSGEGESGPVRDALTALGESVAALAPRDPLSSMDDPDALRTQAEQVRAEGLAERDPVVRASLQRRADALARQAEIAGQTAMLLRRNDALRQEVGVQIGALRTSLAALRIGGRQTAPGLADLATSIQTVAIEAAAVSQARAEIDGLVSRVQGGG